MPRGPLPDPHAERRNAATIPTTVLPLDGRAGPVPEVPSWFNLGPQGRAWWTWAWSTPEAAGWSPSLVDLVGQRAALVDDLWALESVQSLDAFDILACESAIEVKALIFRLSGLATGRLAVLKAMLALDRQLGFGAKNLADLRWKIDEAAKAEHSPAPTEPRRGSRARLRVVGGGD